MHDLINVLVSNLELFRKKKSAYYVTNTENKNKKFFTEASGDCIPRNA